MTDRVSVVADYIYDLLIANKATLTLNDVFYGDQEKIAKSRSVAVESGPLTRTLAGAGTSGRTLNELTVYVIVYVSGIRDNQTVRKEADELAESIMDLLHTDPQMGGNVIHGWVRSIEPGYAIRSGALMRAARVTWTGQSKTAI